MLKSTYGTVILKKDTILYHATDEEFSYRPDSHIRTVFHPSEWTGYDNEYIVKIWLKRDIEVIFWISGFKKYYILSNQPEKKSKDFLEQTEQIKNSKSFNLLCSNDFVIWTERIKIIGTILGFDKKCVKKGNQLSYKNNIVIFFYVNPIKNYNERSEVFSYSCNINTQNWINYPIELMKRSKKYLKKWVNGWKRLI